MKNYNFVRFYFGHYTSLPRWHTKWYPKWLYSKATFSIYYVVCLNMFSYFLRFDSINIIIITIYLL